jgi:peptidoglycan/xylan/chitin deacetylase (PgdA/CDA1 family)
VIFARRPRWLKRLALAPFAVARTSPSFPPGGTIRGEPGDGRVFLTFDDGPHPVHTATVLDRLAAFDVTAGFFLIGKQILDPTLVQRIAAAGHLLGNHTFAHETPRWGDITGARADVARCQEVVPEATLFRPPLGRLTPGLWLAARGLGLRCVAWSLDSGDWRCRSAVDAARCAAQVADAIRPGDIVLFHDDHQWIGPILDVVLPSISGKF